MKLVIHNLSKEYNRVIFNNINIEINDSGFYALTGKNGSGKSTLFRIIKGLENPTSGYIKLVDNDNEYNVKEYVSYCASNPVFFENLTVEENLYICSNNYDRINNLLSLFKIYDKKKIKMKKLSAGEKYRVCLIRTIIEDRPIILLDEITKHLDNKLVEIIFNFFKQLSKEKIIIYTSHYQKDIESYADYVLKIYDKSLNYFETGKDKKNIEKVKYNFNKKTLNKIVRTKLIDILKFINLVIITCVLVLATFIFESKDNLLYRNSISEFSYVITEKNNNVVLHGIDDETRQILSKYNFHDVIHSESIITKSSFNNYYDGDNLPIEVNTYDILSKYNDITLKDNEVVLTDYVYFCLNINNFIYEKDGYKYFDFYNLPIKILDVYKTNFDKYESKINDIYDLYELDHNNPNNYLDALYKITEALDLIFSSYDYSFNEKFCFKRIICNKDTFLTLSKEKRINSGNVLYGNINDENIKYDINEGTIPEKNNEVLVDFDTMRKMILDPDNHNGSNKPYEYLNKELIYKTISVSGKVKSYKIIPVGIVESFNIKATDEFGIEKNKKYTGFLTNSNELIDAIYEWEDFYISSSSLGNNGTINKKVVKEIVNKECVVINNNILNLLNQYNFLDNNKNLIIKISILILIIALILNVLIYVLEFFSINSLLEIIKHTNIDNKLINRKIFKKKDKYLLIQIVILIINYILSVYFVSSLCSNILLFSVDIIVANSILLMVALFIYMVIYLIKRNRIRKLFK